MLDKIARDIGPSVRWATVGRIKGWGIKILTSAKVKRITDEGVVAEKEGKTQTIRADTIILAAGMKPNKALLDALKNKIPRAHAIGDCVEARRILEAIHDGFSMSRSL
jgi:NADH dehydrogenase FAD-containing subunit